MVKCFARTEQGFEVASEQKGNQQGQLENGPIKLYHLQRLWAKKRIHFNALCER